MATAASPIEVFGVGPDGELIALGTEAPSDDRGFNAWTGFDTWSPEGDERGDGRPAMPTYRARPGLRPGGYDDRPGRGGGREDVVAPVRVVPGLASFALHRGELFDEPIPGLEVDVSSLKIDRRGSSWRAVVHYGRIGRHHRRATLRAYPSPSLNLTILELIPVEPRLVHTRAFIRAGVPAVATLSLRLAHSARRLGRQPSSHGTRREPAAGV